MLRITNTITRKKEALEVPLNRPLSLYVCGSTVYDHCHVGHARSAIIYDVIWNYLEYKGFELRYVKNYTDVDDKIIARAEKEDRPWQEVSAEFIAAYEDDMRRLGVRTPTLSPKATEHIPEMLDLIAALIKKGQAYAVSGDVYFSVTAFPDYGKLSHRKTEDLLAGARIEINERKRNPLDFALWKSARANEPSWESPWGKGRPGWHIECSAMAMKHLGPHIDLHGGGEDLIFPHHENEVAQSEAFSGENFVSCWVHHAFVTIDKEKMSKSVGNFFTIDEIFKKSAPLPEKIVCELLRYYLISTHYRSPIDFSEDSLKMAKSSLDHFYALFQKVDELPVDDSDQNKTSLKSPALIEDFEAAMDDDFNTSKALGVLHALRTEANLALKNGQNPQTKALCQTLQCLGKLLGFFKMPHKDWRFQAWALVLETSQATTELSDTEIQSQIAERLQARKDKAWAKSDQIRDELASAGITLEDRPDGTTRFKR